MPAAKRFSSLLSGQPGDRIPTLLYAAQWSVAQAGRPLHTVHDDPHLSLQAQLRTRELIGYDSPPHYAYATYRTWEWAGNRGYPSSELRLTPTVLYYPARR